MYASWVGLVGTQLCTRLAWTLIRCQAEGLFHSSPGQRPGFIVGTQRLQAEGLPNMVAACQNLSVRSSSTPSFLSESDYQRLYEAAEKQSRMLSGLRRSLELA